MTVVILIAAAIIALIPETVQRWKDWRFERRMERYLHVRDKYKQ